VRNQEKFREQCAARPFLGKTDQRGQPDGGDVMAAREDAYVGNTFSEGIRVINVADPRTPVAIAMLPTPNGKAFCNEGASSGHTACRRTARGRSRATY
jgi:hypothetical protein